LPETVVKQLSLLLQDTKVSGKGVTMSETKTKSLKGLTREQIMAETDHAFTGNGEGDGPECFLLNEKEFQLVNEFEKLEETGGTLKQEQAIVLQIRAVIRSLQALGCANDVTFPR
jgi:hypothetical protein